MVEVKTKKDKKRLLQMRQKKPSGLYEPRFEHDACGVGFVCHIKGQASHSIVRQGLELLNNLAHRGAVGAEKNSGDGAGLLIQLPHAFFEAVLGQARVTLPSLGEYGVGQVFLPQAETARRLSKAIFEDCAQTLGLKVFFWRPVPVDNTSLGATAKAAEPVVQQVFVRKSGAPISQDAFERQLYLLRKYSEQSIKKATGETSFYICSLSCRKINYKGQLTPWQLGEYYKDLTDQRVEACFAMTHSRFSTNTMPSWQLAHPFQMLAHNGEINTKQGNVNWMQARAAFFESEFYSAADFEKLSPVLDAAASDSAVLDSVAELLALSGRSLAHAMVMLMPEAWETDHKMKREKRAFYEYHATISEPWDGPAAVCFTDGKCIGGILDRNGLRPARYTLYDNDLLVLASEAGALNFKPEQIVMNQRLEPGKMVLVDLEAGRIVGDEEIKAQLAAAHPYEEWLRLKTPLERFHSPSLRRSSPPEGVPRRQKAFGYTTEELRMVLAPMMKNGEEAVGAMGNDAPLAVLSRRSKNLFSYFHQLFAQVTNPPIDSIREKSFMSLKTFLGRQRNLLAATKAHAQVIELQSPVLTNSEVEKIRWVDQPQFQSKTIQTLFKAQPGALEKALSQLLHHCEAAAEEGYRILILSDRQMDASQAAIPSLLAVSAVHHHLIRTKKRALCSLVVETGEAREVHDLAVLLGYGANAVNPYNVFDSINTLHEERLLPKTITHALATQHYLRATEKGLLKIIAKIGISTIRSYLGAQIFEAVGLGEELVERFFTGTVSRLGGIGLEEIEAETLTRHRSAYLPADEQTEPFALETGGDYYFRQRGEKHLFNPDTVHLLQQACRTNDYGLYQAYAKLINEQNEANYTLRGLLEFKNKTPIALEQVEDSAALFKRFVTGAMSYGSISWEAHTTLALAMNAIKGRSNTGEGGEAEARFKPLKDGRSLRSAIKQVASGRFGVTANYLRNSDEIQIKIAQGAKPGEGGQLPGHKVDEAIAKVRHSTPGVSLISPPPHHDIYSIEDLAQLIYDLKCANPNAKVSVKLVSATGVGTIAAGVAKAYSDLVVIAGYDGGTGASPLTSIKHAGLPWELGLSETHQVLVKNQLRSRILVQTDGQLKTGRDLAIATLLGAEEWGVSSAALVAMGCIMMRKCHLNTCPVGVATQDPDLRRLFTGEAAHVINLFTFMARELRELMAELGFKTINEMVGRVDKLSARVAVGHPKAKKLQLERLLHSEATPQVSKQFCCIPQYQVSEESLDHELIKDLAPLLKLKDKTGREPLEIRRVIRNVNRSVGTVLSSYVTKETAGQGLAEDTVVLRLEGTAGQSFAAFATCGLTFFLTGEANDYFGKGLSGAKVILAPWEGLKLTAQENVIVGNVAFYGATSGKAYINGTAGERFCVRNSGAEVVVESIGAHGCEYMTGGRVIVLGEIGRNFAAGMSGGIAYLFTQQLEPKDGKSQRRSETLEKVNRQLVTLETLEAADRTYLKKQLKKHLSYTRSKTAEEILNHFSAYASSFVKVMPLDYKAALLKQQEEKQRSRLRKKQKFQPLQH